MIVLGLALLAAAPPAEPAPDLVDLAELEPRFAFDIRYATEDNFFGQKVYPVARCALVRDVAERMVRAQGWLDRHHPGRRLLFKDCYRPHSIQHVLWRAVRGTPKARYVADPNGETGSIHSYGAAVDVTLADDDGRELDMGTPYDHLGREAEPRLERALHEAGRLSAQQLENRRVLRRAMVEGAGMRTIPNEWWHFDAAPAKEVRRRYRRLDVPLEAVRPERAEKPAE